MWRSRFCPERLDVPLLRPVPDADAGDHVDVVCAVWDGSSDCHLLCCVRRSGQTQRGLLRGLPASLSASVCQRCRCGQKTVGGQWETGETGLIVETLTLSFYLWSFIFWCHLLYFSCLLCIMFGACFNEKHVVIPIFLFMLFVFWCHLSCWSCVQCWRSCCLCACLY